jgi:peptidoglycan/xylan/chitin deacetylase (PgdA/CDA1 family)
VIRPTASLLAASLAVTFGGCTASTPHQARGGLDSVLEYSPYHRNRHNAVVRVVTSHMLVALTFDDGPSPRTTPALLRILASAGAHATFFVVGSRVERHPELICAEVREGHELADHTYSHRRLPLLSSREIAHELAGTARAIELAGAPPPRWSRPPWGFFDERVGAIAAAQGTPLVGWDVTLERALDGRSIRTGVRALVAQVRPGSIVLAHDGPGARARTVAALPVLLAALRRKGLRATSVGRLLRSAGARAYAGGAETAGGGQRGGRCDGPTFSASQLTSGRAASSCLRTRRSHSVVCSHGASACRRYTARLLSRSRSRRGWSGA